MAGTLTITGFMSFEGSNGDSVDSDGIDMTSYEVSISTEKWVKGKLTVTTGEVAIPLGGVSSPGYGMFKNLDVTNFLEIRVSTGGAKSIKLGPGQSSGPVRLGSGSAVPYAIADTASCEMAYLIISN